MGKESTMHVVQCDMHMHTCVCVYVYVCGYTYIHAVYTTYIYINMLTQEGRNEKQTMAREGTKMTEWMDSPGVFCFLFVIWSFDHRNQVLLV